MSQFKAKWQAYSLTIWWKIDQFQRFLMYHNNIFQLQIWVNLKQNSKPIALLFGEKSTNFNAF